MPSRPFLFVPLLAFGVTPVLAGDSVDDGLQRRLALQAAIQTINSELLASSSATLTLEDWCRRHGLAPEPRMVVRFPGTEAVPPDATQRERLEVDPAEPVRYRQVELVCGEAVLSRAENWYVPGRLTPEMNAALDGSDTPYGRVIRPLRPFRRTVAADMLWQPLPDGWTVMTQPALREAVATLAPLDYDPERPLFAHTALVFAGDGRPLAEVRETYRMALLGSLMR